MMRESPSRQRDPMISVLMPVKDAMPYLPVAVESILAQDCADFEFLIIDDGSTDRSWDYLTSLGDPRIRLFRNDQNVGIAQTLILGLEKCAAPFIARMDADDISMPARFSKQASALLADPDIIVVGTGAEAFGNRQFRWKVPETEDGLRAYLIFDCVFPHSSVMMRKSLMDVHGLNYSTAAAHAEDYDLWVRASAKGKLAGINEPLIHYRLHDRSMSITRAECQQQRADQVRRFALKTFLDYELRSDEILPMRRLAGVYAHRFAKTAEELAEARRLQWKLMQAARAIGQGTPYIQEISARWERTRAWAGKIQSNPDIEYNGFRAATAEAQKSPRSGRHPELRSPAAARVPDISTGAEEA